MTLADKIEQADAPCRDLDISMLSAEQIGTYTRAFIENKADYLVVDGWQLRKQWMRDDIAQLTALRFLTVDQLASELESDSQYTAICYRPSEEFRTALAAAAMRARGR